MQDHFPGAHGTATTPRYRPGTMQDPNVIRLSKVSHHLPRGRQDFAASLIDQATHRKPLSVNQLEWVTKLTTLAENAMNPPAQALAVPPMRSTPVADGIRLAPIAAMFDKARSAGLKRPSIRICVAEKQLRLSAASATSRNSGYLYVYEGDKQFDAYRGKISPDGAYTGDEGIVPALREMAANPAGVASAHGKLTGNCCFCSRDLTDQRSVSVGYGPICADRFGLPWG